MMTQPREKAAHLGRCLRASLQLQVAEEELRPEKRPAELLWWQAEEELPVVMEESVEQQQQRHQLV